MDYTNWILLIDAAAFVVFVIQVIRLILADADLTVMWKQKFGPKPESLARKVVWITGASSGIGEYVAYELAKAGAKLILSARRESELERVKKKCLLYGKVREEDILILPLDLLKTDTHTEAVNKALQYFKSIDVVFHNAGRSQRALIQETDLEVDRQILDLDLVGVISLTKAVLPHFVQQKKGHFVVNSSIAGKTGVANGASYSAAKFGLHGWFETLRMELSAQNIEVSMICVGPTFSGLLPVSFTGDPRKEYGKSMEAHERRMQTDRCAELIVVAMANRLDEAWIALQPVLFFTYLIQYTPTIGRWFSKKIGMKVAVKVRDGK